MLRLLLDRTVRPRSGRQTITPYFSLSLFLSQLGLGVRLSHLTSLCPSFNSDWASDYHTLPLSVRLPLSTRTGRQTITPYLSLVSLPLSTIITAALLWC